MPRPRLPLPSAPTDATDLTVPVIVALFAQHGAPRWWGIAEARALLYAIEAPNALKADHRIARGDTGASELERSLASDRLWSFTELYATAPDAFPEILAGAHALLRKLSSSREFNLAVEIAIDPDMRRNRGFKELVDILSERMGRAVSVKAIEKAVALLHTLTSQESPSIPKNKGE